MIAVQPSPSVPPREPQERGRPNPELSLPPAVGSLRLGDFAQCPMMAEMTSLARAPRKAATGLCTTTTSTVRHVSWRIAARWPSSCTDAWHPTGTARNAGRGGITGRHRKHVRRHTPLYSPSLTCYSSRRRRFPFLYRKDVRRGRCRCPVTTLVTGFDRAAAVWIRRDRRGLAREADVAKSRGLDEAARRLRQSADAAVGDAPLQGGT